MSQVINTNALSLMAQNNLNKSQNSLGSAIQRLSSGLRINSAKDDAAGQAISNRFTASITGLTQASRNANDGISIAQTTEGALNEINDNLQNIRCLSVQASNGTNSASDRQSIQDEINERLAEINRISEQTEFNGVKVLSKDQTLNIQVGANDGETISLKLERMDAEKLGMEDFDVGVFSTANTQVVKVADYGTTAATDVAIGDDANAYKLTADDVKALNTKFFGTDTPATGSEIKTDGKGNFIATGVDKEGKTVQQSFSLEENEAGDGFTIKDKGAYVTEQQKADADVVVETMLKTVDDALNQVDALRSNLGAAQNRFASVISNLDSTVNNLSESRSRILDADFASEVSNMSRANILQSAGTTVLAQANQVPQNVLSLLR
ncbi:MAG: FliC/FljB family flagellin [Pantoea sp.]|nr:FliC/FljB family flagellin [Pantoea sp.]